MFQKLESATKNKVERDHIYVRSSQTKYNQAMLDNTL